MRIAEAEASDETSAPAYTADMQLRPLRPADLDLIDEIDATIASDRFLFVERNVDGLNAQLKVEERRHAEPRIEANPIGDELRFALKQVAAGIEEGLAVVAEHDDVPIAALLATASPDGSVVDVVDVRVDYDRRRDGLGSAMLFQAINHARERDARVVRVAARASNVPLASMLVKLGFELGGLDAFRESNHDLVKEQTTLLWCLPLR